ncbi:mechanosensitive ion channel family protein [uncultured Paludibaculum sp.]|uniref:mechanosensitive ion channel family protein n=1 Tax=uncultured Paludibaculum sp. TaxID=1765020 RepID=UPI002AAAB775|nr:mechanosensitive ion channel family protein [uncultured Paludibaculum sp.]
MRLIPAFALTLLCSLWAQQPGATVFIDGQEVLRVYTGAAPFTVEERAADIRGRIEKIGDKDARPDVTIKDIPAQSVTAVLAGSVYIMLVTNADAQAAGTPREELAARYALAIQKALESYRDQHTLVSYLIAAAKTLIAWAAFCVLCWLLKRGVDWLNHRVTLWFQRETKARQVRGFSLILWQRASLLALNLLKIVMALFLLSQVSLLLSFTFSLFPQTSGISTTLIDYLRVTFGGIARSVLDYLPKGGFVVIVCVISYYLLRILHIVARAIEHGDLAVPGLHPEMAIPTYQLARILVVVFALVVSFPYLPGGQSDAFKGVSIFLGVLISIGSGSSVGNVLAGITLTYMRPYRAGDRVQFGDTVGDVLEKSLLVTRLRTIKNVEVVIPNSAILGGMIQNFSAMARNRGLILHTTVTIGYDAPWRQVHELLIRAAQNTEGILIEPVPFILQTALNDFNISYQLNAFTDRPNEFEFTYSRLHQNIQDAFNKAGVEIMSPNYLALRDGNTVTTPEADRPPHYQPPSFRVNP